MSNCTVNQSRNFYMSCTVTKYFSMIVLKPVEFLTHRILYLFIVLMLNNKMYTFQINVLIPFFVCSKCFAYHVLFIRKIICRCSSL